MNEHIDRICTDLKTAARFLMEDGYSLDEGETVRIGIALAELAGTMLGSARVVTNEKEHGTNA